MSVIHKIYKWTLANPGRKASLQQFPEVKLTWGLFKKEICLFYVLNLACNSHWIFFCCCSFSHGFYYVHIAVLTDGTYRTLSDCKHCSSSMTQHRSNASILAKEAREKKNWNILFWCMEWNWKGLVKDKRQKRKWLSSLTNITTDIKLEDLYGDIAMTNLYCKTENSDFFFCIIFSGHQDWAQC